MLREFSEDVAAGHFALAESLTALLRNRLTSDWVALLTLQNELLEQNLAAAERGQNACGPHAAVCS